MGSGNTFVAELTLDLLLPRTRPAAAFLLLNGVWILVFGVSLTKGKDRLYYSGWGVVMVSLSTFAVLPLQYVLGSSS